MRDEHASARTMERFFSADLPPGECREVVRHLLARCPECTAIARTVGAGQGYTPAGTRPVDARPAFSAGHYDRAFATAWRRVNEEQKRLTQSARLRTDGHRAALARR